MYTNDLPQEPVTTTILVTIALLFAIIAPESFAQTPETQSPVVRLAAEDGVVHSLQYPCELQSAMSSISLRPDETRMTPPDYADAAFSDAACEDLNVLNRHWQMPQAQWSPTGLWHNPLYFEEPNLERHGLTFGVAQPAVSAAHFLGNVAALPYHMAIRHPQDCVYSLGDCRPGDPVPYYRYREPFNKHASITEAAAIVGLVLLLP